MTRAEVVAPSFINDFGGDLQSLVLEKADVGDAVEQVARLARFHLPVFDHVVVQNVIEGFARGLHAAHE